MHRTNIGEHSFDIQVKDGKYQLNGHEGHLNFLEKQSGSFHCEIDGVSHEADLVKLDTENKQITLRIKGQKVLVQIQEPVDLLLDKVGLKIEKHKKVNQLKAPMPGLVLRILVEPGQAVSAGEPLLILEAMKMENVFKAHTDVVIKSIPVTEKQAVEKGQDLILFQ